MNDQIDVLKNKHVEVFRKYEELGPYHWGWYDDNFMGYKDLVDLAIKYIPSSGSVLDVGCGDGLTTFKLFEKGLVAKGLDSSELGIQYANTEVEKKIKELNDIKLLERYRKGEIEFLDQSIYDFESSMMFDYVLCHDVIEHLEYPEQCINNIYKCMKKFAVISTPNANTGILKKYDYQKWSPKGFEEFLKGYHFEFVHLDEKKMYVKLYK